MDGQLFATIQRELFFSLVMHLTRITDRDKKGRVTLAVLGTDVDEQRCTGPGFLDKWTA